MNFLEIIMRNITEEPSEILETRKKPLPLSDYILSRSGIIGEFKRKTPTKEFKICLPPEEIGKIYEKYNFSAVSVVVEKNFFSTTDDDLKRIKNAISIPVIQKGFIREESQIIKAANNGADSVLLIVRLLDRERLINLLRFCHQIQMEPIVEIYSENEIEIIKDLPLKIIGVNNRNLETLKVDLNHGEEVLSRVIEEKLGEVRIIESGLKDPEDILRFKKIGADGFLIGTYFLESHNIEESVQKFSVGVDKCLR